MIKDRGLNPAGDIAAIDRADQPNYLGDTAVIDSLLRQFFNDALQRRAGGMEREAAKASDISQAEELAGVLLGRYSGFTPQPAWNSEGGIDAWLAEKLNISETDAVLRMQTALLGALVDFYKIINYSQQEGVLEEQWNWQIDALVKRWTLLLLGIPEEAEA